MGDDKTRRLILARRARFIAATLASVAATTTAIGAGTEACGGATDQQLNGGSSGGSSSGSSGGSSGSTSSGGSSSGIPQPCLSQPYEPPKDAGDKDDVADANAKDAKVTKDADPLPCLAPPLPDD